MNRTIQKGQRVQARWLRVTQASLAGMQPKVGAVGVEVTGVVRHVRGDHPTTPTKVALFVGPEGSYDGDRVTPPGCTCGPHVQVDPAHVAAILDGDPR